MSYRFLDNIDEKIINATILIGSQNGANHLSTKEIAKACDISEFVIYDHFKSKENLVSAADKKICEESGKQALALCQDPIDFPKFWNAMVDFFLSQPNYPAFLISYGHIYPRAQRPSDYDDFLNQNLTPVAKTVINALRLKEDNDKTICHEWMWILRTIVTYSQFVLGGSLDSDPALRELSCKLAAQGTSSLTK